MSIALRKPPNPQGQQVAQRLRRLIARRYKPGDVLPTYRALSDELAVGLRSVFDGMNVLADQGLVQPVRRVGTKVVRRPGRGASGLSMVAVVPRGRIDDLFLGYKGWILSGIGAQVERRRLSLLLFPQRDDSLVPIDEVLASGADGILLVGVVDAEYTRGCLATDLPVVLVDQADDALRVDMIVCDNPGAAAHLVEHLLRLGHRRFAYASHAAAPWSDYDNRERRASFERALQQAGLAPAAPECALHNTGPHAPNPVADAFVAGWVGNPAGPTAIVTDSESTLRCVMAAAQRAGVRVPHDVSLAALAIPPDDWAGAEGPLSGCCMDFAAMGRSAVAALERRSRTPTAALRKERAPYLFSPGQTVGPPPTIARGSTTT